jgi:hypothetical protein
VAATVQRECAQHRVRSALAARHAPTSEGIWPDASGPNRLAARLHMWARTVEILSQYSKYFFQYSNLHQTLSFKFDTVPGPKIV